MLLAHHGTASSRIKGNVDLSVISSICCDLDVIHYDGGQVWSNYITSPADGETQTAYDFHLGSSDSNEAAEDFLFEDSVFKQSG